MVTSISTEGPRQVRTTSPVCHHCDGDSRPTPPSTATRFVSPPGPTSPTISAAGVRLRAATETGRSTSRFRRTSRAAPTPCGHSADRTLSGAWCRNTGAEPARNRSASQQTNGLPNTSTRRSTRLPREDWRLMCAQGRRERRFAAPPLCSGQRAVRPPRDHRRPRPGLHPPERTGSRIPRTWLGVPRRVRGSGDQVPEPRTCPCPCTGARGASSAPYREAIRSRRLRGRMSVQTSSTWSMHS